MLTNFISIKSILTINNAKNNIIILKTIIYFSIDILEKDVDERDNESTKKAKQFFHACMNLSKYI